MDRNPKAYSYIRMSTDIQLKGDSRRRQLEASLAYAQVHGLELVEGDQLEDIGISAFSGANVKDGALGKFLDAVKNGRVPTGSFLLVESLDRISRLDVRKSLTIFLSIIQAGITIVTLADNQVYSPEATDLPELVMSIMIMSRAHEESRTKSLRVGAAWANKRANAEKTPLTKLCPAWLRLSEDRRQYVVIEDRAEVVRRIFRETIAGMGNYTVTRRLNVEKIPTFGRSKGWHKSYITKILDNRSVIGEFQPHKMQGDGRRAPVGGSIAGYYPAVVEAELFYRAQGLRADRRVSGRGRKGQYITNLFSGLTTCAYCKSSMQFENKGPLPKGGSFLVCSDAKRGLGCTVARWRYSEFEASFLAFVDKLDLSSLVRGEGEDHARLILEEAISAGIGEQRSIQRQMEQTYALLTTAGSAADFVGGKLDELQRRYEVLAATLLEKQGQLQALDRDIVGFAEGKDEIKSLVLRLQKPVGNDEVYKLRAQIASRIRDLVDTLIVGPLGTAPQTQRAIEFLKENSPSGSDDVVAHMESTQLNPANHQRYFLVGFKDGTALGVYPSDDDPLEFEQRVMSVKFTMPGTELSRKDLVVEVQDR